MLQASSKLDSEYYWRVHDIGRNKLIGWWPYTISDLRDESVDRMRNLGVAKMTESEIEAACRTEPRLRRQHHKFHKWVHALRERNVRISHQQRFA